MPTDKQWLAFERWGKEHDSEIIHFDLLGNHFIVVNSMDAARELFEKRSAIYSDRPFLPSSTILLGYHWTMPLLPYGDRLRALRKGFHTFLQPTPAKEYRPLEREAVLQLLLNVLHNPEGFMAHLRHMAGAIILGIAYGIKVQPHDDPYVETVEKGLQAAAAVSEPHAQLFDLLPCLVHVPSWFPGVGWKRFAEKNHHWSTDVLEHPYLATKEAMARGTATPSVAATMTTEMESNGEMTPEGEAFVKQLVGNMYVAGADTTVCALENFILAMILYPEVQKKAQAEIDAVVGHDRLPDFSDEKLLPYVGALAKEVLRWRNVTPLGVPHRLTTDDVWKGYFLPENSTVLGNIWAILHDESVYGPDALSFNPDRYVNSDLPDPEIAFGFGRRVCPGQYMARDSIWLAVTLILATMDISKAVDENGEEIEPEQDYASSTVAYPRPFKCSIKPRSNAAAKLVDLETSDKMSG
ncbi:cytochrome P450 [Stereum hirsutum FP-91666 SS1]|uniref:cytochrome P450 n=1 Tax=Stereum hirsutum (strain FP-91666) TaxID=721885 RepID=UPI000444A4FC|nr:cytochrome P450 [Stereum hirsutum FP-91666 SS1]EIM84324.1 cytochrome P450 [Stereum hirsutum FP-91666 SS1]